MSSRRRSGGSGGVPAVISSIPNALVFLGHCHFLSVMYRSVETTSVSHSNATNSELSFQGVSIVEIMTMAGLSHSSPKVKNSAPKIGDGLSCSVLLRERA